jgi:hypothetical protein
MGKIIMPDGTYQSLYCIRQPDGRNIFISNGGADQARHA